MLLGNDNWDDFGFKTFFEFKSVGEDGEVRAVGFLKIGQFGMGEEGGAIILPAGLTELDDSHFSLGQDPAHYSNLMVLPDDVGHRALIALRDVANDEQLWQWGRDEPVTAVSPTPASLVWQI